MVSIASEGTNSLSCSLSWGSLLLNVQFCSQSLESTAEQLRLRSPEFLQDHDIEVLTEKEVRWGQPEGQRLFVQEGYS